MSVALNKVLSRLVPAILTLGSVCVLFVFGEPAHCQPVGTATSAVGISGIGGGNDIAAAVQQAVALAGGMPEGIGPESKIVVQPNLTEAGWTSGSGVITHSSVVRAIIALCIQEGASPSNIYICEGSAGFHGDQAGYSLRQATLKAFRDSGLDVNGDMFEDAFGARIVDANNVGQLYPSYPDYSGPYDTNYVMKITRSDFLIDRAYYLPNIVGQCDFLIRVPALKNHNLAGITGALKLSFGHAASDIYHAHWTQNYKWNLLHWDRWGEGELITNAKGMADMTLCRPPDLVVMDALVGVTNGPVGDGGPIYTPAEGHMLSVLASSDPVAIDTVEALACTYRADLQSVPGIYFAALQGLGSDNPGKVTVRGKHVRDIRRFFPLWGSADRGDTVAPVIGDIDVVLGAGNLLIVAPVGSYDASPGLCKGELHIDGVLVDSNDSGGYATSCSLAGAASGNHAVTYTIYDGMLNETSITRMLNVSNGSPVTSALGATEGEGIFLGPVVFTGAAPAIDSRTFFVASPDGTSGLRVRCSGGVPQAALGQRLSLYGTLANTDGQRYLDCKSVTVLEGGDPVRPLFMQNVILGGVNLNPHTFGVAGGEGPYNLGCLVRAYGQVSSGGADWFYIEDGSLGGKLKVLSGSFSQPAPGSLAFVTGFSCCEEENGSLERVLVLRSQADLATQP